MDVRFVFLAVSYGAIRSLDRPKDKRKINYTYTCYEKKSAEIRICT